MSSLAAAQYQQSGGCVPQSANQAAAAALRNLQQARSRPRRACNEAEARLNLQAKLDVHVISKHTVQKGNCYFLQSLPVFNKFFSCCS